MYWIFIAAILLDCSLSLAVPLSVGFWPSDLQTLLEQEINCRWSYLRNGVAVSEDRWPLITNVIHKLLVFLNTPNPPCCKTRGVCWKQCIQYIVYVQLLLHVPCIQHRITARSAIYSGFREKWCFAWTMTSCLCSPGNPARLCLAWADLDHFKWPKLVQCSTVFDMVRPPLKVVFTLPSHSPPHKSPLVTVGGTRAFSPQKMGIAHCMSCLNKHLMNIKIIK